ncbi:hypothetical protein H5410_044455 [Solanum commersonii]|uniref:Uncharacterized protein n=1 Tax=Solanum commersonii TaxID=4109 RepID=A0A9J5X932_SOLCO|nr:hypothetical protein H5410_044455 [Solanum commersonii]
MEDCVSMTKRLGAVCYYVTSDPSFALMYNVKWMWNKYGYLFVFWDYTGFVVVVGLKYKVPLQTASSTSSRAADVVNENRTDGSDVSLNVVKDLEGMIKNRVIYVARIRDTVNIFGGSELVTPLVYVAYAILSSKSNQKSIAFGGSGTYHRHCLLGSSENGMAPYKILQKQSEMHSFWNNL